MKQRFFLRSADIKRNAARFVFDLPVDADKPLVVDIKPMTRSIEQNAKLWATLSDVAEQVEWYGRKLDAESWKHIFSAALKKQDVVPNLDGSGFVVLGLSTSKMSVAEMRDMLELINAFCAERGVKLNDQVAA